MVPSLDDIQQAINRMIQLIMEVNRGIAQWGQKHLQKSRLKPEASKQQLSSAGLPGQVKKKSESKWFGFVFLLLILTFVFN